MIFSATLRAADGSTTVSLLFFVKPTL